MRNRWWAGVGLAAAAVVLAACGSSGGGSSSTNAGSGSSSSGIKVLSTSSGKVLTNAAGHTLYWYAIDTKSKSNCTGQCASFWPAVPASTKVTGSGLPGTFGSITGTNGSKQLTYDGHPLYTFKLDTASGQIKGNGVTTSGGTSNELWWAMTPSGSKLNGGAPAPASTGGGGGGGYGY